MLPGRPAAAVGARPSEGVAHGFDHGSRVVLVRVGLRESGVADDHPRIRLFGPVIGSRVHLRDQFIGERGVRHAGGDVVELGGWQLRLW